MTTTEATRDRAGELQARLAEQVASLVSGDDWAQMLATAAKFHRYSPNNVLLILSQCPEATRVAGYRAWQRLGRQVRKGERGIWILAPARYKVTDEDGTERFVLRGFTTVAVFDVSQTEGAPLAEPVRPDLLAGEAPAGLWEGLAAQVGAAGYAIVRGGCGGANGSTSFSDRTVTVRDDVEPAQATKTLAHELAHILCGHEAWHSIDRERMEVEAESVAYVVCAAAGMSTEGYSLPYVATWAAGDVGVVRASAARVVEVAGRILEALGVEQ